MIYFSGAVYCRADRRDFYDFVKIPETSDFLYIRRHGARGQNRYPDADLAADAAAIRHWVRQKKQVFVYFNNDAKGDAIDNAKILERFF